MSKSSTVAYKRVAYEKNCVIPVPAQIFSEVRLKRSKLDQKEKRIKSEAQTNLEYTVVSSIYIAMLQIILSEKLIV